MAGLSGALPSLLVGYLLGSIPFGFLLVRLRAGVDLRQVGSGNVGATNAGRVLGRWAAVVVYALDASKGLAAARVLPRLFDAGGGLVPVVAGFAAVLGHCFPVFLRF